MTQVVMVLCAGERWLDVGGNLILLGPPAGGKTHLATAIDLSVVNNGHRIL